MQILNKPFLLYKCTVVLTYIGDPLDFTPSLQEAVIVPLSLDLKLSLLDLCGCAEFLPVQLLRECGAWKVFFALCLLFQ